MMNSFFLCRSSLANQRRGVPPAAWQGPELKISKIEISKTSQWVLFQWFEKLQNECCTTVKIALVHAQFETIHPFLDGNGRIGRLLIATLLEHWGLLPEPLMYLSGYLKQHQLEYYRRLSIIRTEGDWESWMTFFLEGVAAALDAERSIIAIASLVAADRRRLLESPKAGTASYRLFEMLPIMPRFTIERVRQKLDTTFPTANAAVKVLEDLGIVTEMTGQKKNRSYSYQPYIELLTR